MTLPRGAFVAWIMSGVLILAVLGMCLAAACFPAFAASGIAKLVAGLGVLVALLSFYAAATLSLDR